MDHLCYSCLVFVMLSSLFITALWSPAGNGLTSWLLFVMFNCVLSLPHVVSIGQVWYLIVSIPDLYRLSYFYHIGKIYIILLDKYFALFDVTSRMLKPSEK